MSKPFEESAFGHDYGQYLTVAVHNLHLMSTLSIFRLPLDQHYPSPQSGRDFHSQYHLNPAFALHHLYCARHPAHPSQPHLQPPLSFAQPSPTAFLAQPTHPFRINTHPLLIYKAQTSQVSPGPQTHLALDIRPSPHRPSNGISRPRRRTLIHQHARQHSQRQRQEQPRLNTRVQLR